MNSPNIALQNEQNKRLLSDSLAVEAKIDRETQKYLDGKADAALGIDPTQPANQYYWQGYQEQLQQNWISAKQEAVTITSSK